jgi:hypothetical protein
MISFLQNTLLPVVLPSLVPFVIVALVGLCIRIVAVWFFRRTDSAIMKERINEGSELFFKDQREKERAYIAGGQPPPERIDPAITATRRKRPPTGSRQ